MRLLVATRNAHKLGEIRALLDGLPVMLSSPADFPGAPEVDEDQPTLEGNARKKALALYEHTGLPSLADDTGLEVTALGGRPGVHSARYAGEPADDARNRTKLLRERAEAADRSARFRTVIAFADDTGVRTFDGVCEGHIAAAARGTGGFGYDPLFVPENDTRTFAELSADAKNRISHRGRALRSFAAFLRETLAP